jgi:hypothetical protein
LSTFLALVVPNETTSAPLSPKSFTAVWFLTSIPFAIFSGLFKYVAFALIGITGGTSLALALSITIHPNLLTRRIFLALLILVFFILTLTPFARTQRKSIRLATSASGTFGLIMSISLLAHVQPWSNVWERLWITDGNGWGSGPERALCAGYWLILIAGCSADWALKKYCGGNPDEEWDTYVTEYATSLPTSRDRAGLFRPPSYSFWDRLFPWMHRSKPPVVSEYLFPPDDKYTCPPHLSFDQRKTQSMMQSVLTHDNSPNFSRRQTQDPLARLRGFGNAGVHGYRKREAVKFGAVNPDDLSSDDEDDPLSTPPPLARRTSTLSSLTLTNGSNVDSWKTSPMKGDQEKGGPVRRAVLLDQENDAPDYSDYEEDVTNVQTHTDRNLPGWKPQIFARHGSDVVNPASSVGAVPMTPSLIRAVDRIAAAQAQAYDTTSGPDTSRGGREADTESVLVRKQRWDVFWRDVTAKASEGSNAR